jgi:hypothetical protein
MLRRLRLNFLVSAHTLFSSEQYGLGARSLLWDATVCLIRCMPETAERRRCCVTGKSPHGDVFRTGRQCVCPKPTAFLRILPWTSRRSFSLWERLVPPRPPRRPHGGTRTFLRTIYENRLHGLGRSLSRFNCEFRPIYNYQIGVQIPDDILRYTIRSFPSKMC